MFNYSADDFSDSWNEQSIFPCFSCLSSFLFCSMGFFFFFLKMAKTEYLGQRKFCLTVDICLPECLILAFVAKVFH